MAELVLENRLFFTAVVLPILATAVGPKLIERRQWLLFATATVFCLWLGTVVFTAKFEGFDAVWRAFGVPALFLAGSLIVHRANEKERRNSGGG